MSQHPEYYQHLQELPPGEKLFTNFNSQRPTKEQRALKKVQRFKQEAIISSDAEMIAMDADWELVAKEQTQLEPLVFQSFFQVYQIYLQNLDHDVEQTITQMALQSSTEELVQLQAFCQQIPTMTVQLQEKLTAIIQKVYHDRVSAAPAALTA